MTTKKDSAAPTSAMRKLRDDYLALAKLNKQDTHTGFPEEVLELIEEYAEDADAASSLNTTELATVSKVPGGLRAVLETIQQSTVPAPTHTDPGSIQDCWNEVFETIDRLESHPTTDTVAEVREKVQALTVGETTNQDLIWGFGDCKLKVLKLLTDTAPKKEGKK